MKNIWFIIFLFAQKAFCQTNALADSLLKDLTKQQTDTGKIKTLSELTFLYANNNPTLALQYANRQKVIADKINIPKFTANAYNDIAIAQYYSGDYSNALRNNKAALAIREKLGIKGLLVSSLNKIAIIYQELGKYDTAATYQFKILKLAEELKDDVFIGKTSTNISTLFEKLGNFKEGEFYARKALVSGKKANDNSAIARAYVNIGEVFKQKNNYDSAASYLEMAGVLFEKDDDQVALMGAYNNIGFLKTSLGKINESLQYHQKAYTIAGLLQNENKQAACATNIGEDLIRLGRVSESFPYFVQAKKTALQENNLDVLRDVYNDLSNYYFLTQKADSAFHYQSLYKSIVDTIFSTNSSKQINELQTQYETEKKEQQIALLNKENTIQKLTINKNRIYIAVALIVLFAGLGFAYLLYNRYKIKQNIKLQQEVMRQQEIATEAVIEAEENERKRIARDLHDGVGQMMSAAKMNLSLLNNYKGMDPAEKTAYEKAMALVDESCKEVRSISHNMMPNALIKMGLASAVRNFIEQIESPSLKVQLYTEGLNESLNKNTETVLYRVLQECVNNVIKHAAASNLDIALIKDETGINATIEDNGKGFDTSDKNKFAGIGLDNIQKRINFLKGQIEWNSKPGNGTLVAIHIPVGG